MLDPETDPIDVCPASPKKRVNHQISFRSGI